MSELLALAERCEKAEGPDRELDAEIAALFGEVTWEQANYTMDQYAAIRWREPHPYAGMAEPVYQYTALLDAAMSLVPEQSEWSLWSPDLDAGETAFACEISPTDAAWKAGQLAVAAYGCATPALALAAASLRALSSMETPRG